MFAVLLQLEHCSLHARQWLALSANSSGGHEATHEAVALNGVTVPRQAVQSAGVPPSHEAQEASQLMHSRTESTYSVFAHSATQLPAPAASLWWYMLLEQEVQLLAERLHVRNEASQLRQLPPLSYAPVTHEETHAPEENETPGVHARQLASPAPLHVLQVASHAMHMVPSRYLPSGHEATQAPLSR